MATNYQRGRAFEYRTRDRLYKDGAVYVMRAAQSKGLADLLALFPQEDDLAWAAGFFDGEGCTSVHRQEGQPSYVRVSVAQKDLRPLERFKSAVGEVGGIDNRDLINASGAHQWRVCGSKALEVLSLLWPYLSAPKLEQAERVMEECGASLPPPRPFTGTLLVQCKTGKARLKPEDRIALVDVARQCGAEAYLAEPGPNGRGVTFTLLEED